ncbi:WD repeat-containing protein 78-like isoform X1 [Neolamprologus brichardi]|uniref:WD repeat-containing protein 78-like isoform X1 n=1 Tax=Neolamprologus brichardi TaxID=32507 RepID=UPI001643E954|nr:WD repeat-containing protein 78-like isoform X1 [Neolamprologus brichardi]
MKKNSGCSSITSLTKTSSGSGLCQGTLTGNGYNQKENPEEQKRRNKDLIERVRVFSISLKLFLHDGDAGSYLNILIYRDFSCSHTLLVVDADGTDVTPHPLVCPVPGFQKSLDELFSELQLSRSSHPICPTQDSLNAEIEDMFLGPTHPPPQLLKKGDDAEQHAREKMVGECDYISLTETKTITFLDISPTIISVVDDDAEAVKQRNLSYAELCKSKTCSDKYVDRSMQTLNGALKNKLIQSERTGTAGKGMVATNWDIYDSFYKQNETFEGDEAVLKEKSVSSKSNTTYIDSTISSLSEMEICGSILNPEPEPEKEILLPELLTNISRFMERTVVLNAFQAKLAAYRQPPISEGSDSMTKHGKHSEESLDPTLELLWAFTCERTRGYWITSMAWNRHNPDILAVGYADFDSRCLKPGLICCWTIKNIMWPERVFDCHSSVTSLDFSANDQLAVGMYDGTVAIYNICIQDSSVACVASSSKSSRRHLHPVWQVTWTPQRLSLEDVLVSVSSDGRIAKWSISSHNLDSTDLMWFRSDKECKEAAENQKKKKIVLSKPTAVCVDFHPTDFGIYLVGTQEGLIHKSSFSEVHSFLATYKKHIGSVNHIEWSPFRPHVFLSCSRDETVQMWKQGRPVMTFKSIHQGPVIFVKWSPNCSTLFGVVKEDQVEIWDLNLSILFPTIVHHAEPGVRLTSLLFARGTDCVLVGDSNGQVTVYKLKNFRVCKSTQVDTLDEIIQHATSRYF